MAGKRRGAKKPARKKAARKTVKKTAKRKVTAKKSARKPVRGGMVISVPPALEARLKMLATNMTKTLEEVIAQALAEFAETWEHHMQTVAALKEDEGRVHLSVPKE